MIMNSYYRICVLMLEFKPLCAKYNMHISNLRVKDLANTSLTILWALDVFFDLIKTRPFFCFSEHNCFTRIAATIKGYFSIKTNEYQINKQRLM